MDRWPRPLLLYASVARTGSFWTTPPYEIHSSSVMPDEAGRRRNQIVIPLSFAQRRLWFLHKLEGPSATYNMPLTLRLKGDVDAEALRTALRDVMERHESLRTVFPDVDGDPHQLVLGAAEFTLDWESRQVTEVELADALHAAARHTFDLSTDVPLRAQLYRVGSDECVLLLLIHHIAGDGWSMGPLARDVLEAYTARAAPRPGPGDGLRGRRGADLTARGGGTGAPALPAGAPGARGPPTPRRATAVRSRCQHHVLQLPRRLRGAPLRRPQPERRPGRGPVDQRVRPDVRPGTADLLLRQRRAVHV
ncbi:hypothetical protein CG747_16790 [Streptomyces sp. CB02959]|nr:hypothetical protein CG747_16790 [Streptomyces sp. CB02959]